MNFLPSDLEPVKQLCAAGIIPLSFSRTRHLCRSGKFPAIKFVGQWHTTRTLAKSFLYRGANAAFRRAVA